MDPGDAVHQGALVHHITNRLWGFYMTKKTLEQLQEQHSEMCATAADLGMTVPQDLTADFTTVEAGSAIVSSLDALIRKFKEGLDDQESSNTSEKALAADEKKSDTDVPSPRPKSKKSESKTKSGDKVSSPKQEGVTNVAKKAAVKKAAAPKKGAAKKANVAVSAKPKNGFDENAKITWGAKPNPAREGSGRHDRIEAVKKASGKTVKTFLANKGNATTLKNCVTAKLCTVA